MRMAVEACGVLPEEVHVLVVVCVHDRAPSPRTIVSGKGGWWIVVRVFPPGITRARASWNRRDSGFDSA